MEIKKALMKRPQFEAQSQTRPPAIGRPCIEKRSLRGAAERQRQRFELRIEIVLGRFCAFGIGPLLLHFTDHDVPAQLPQVAVGIYNSHPIRRGLDREEMPYSNLL